MEELRDPCGNLIPLPVKIPTVTLPSVPDLLKLLADLLGVKLPVADFDVPCPVLLDKAEEAAGTAIG